MYSKVAERRARIRIMNFIPITTRKKIGYSVKKQGRPDIREKKIFFKLVGS